MSGQPSGSAAGLLLVLVGVLVLTQTLVGGLVERILGASSSSSPAKSTVGSQAAKALRQSAQAMAGVATKTPPGSTPAAQPAGSPPPLVVGTPTGSKK